MRSARESTLPPLGETAAALKAIALLALPRLLDHVVADSAGEFCFKRLLHGHISRQHPVAAELLQVSLHG